MARALRRRIAVEGIVNTQVVGPAPGTPERVRGHFRWHLVLRGQDPASLLEQGRLPPGWALDVDPVSVL